MKTVEFTEQIPAADVVAIVTSKGVCSASIYSNERQVEHTPDTEAGEDFEPYTMWAYDRTTFTFTPGKLITVEAVKAAPEVFAVLEGDLDKLVSDITQKVQDYIDGWAQARGYDNIHTAMGYKSSSVPRFQMEGTILAKLCDECWYQVNVLENKAVAGDRTALSDLLYLPAGLPEPDFSAVPEIA